MRFSATAKKSADQRPVEALGQAGYVGIYMHPCVGYTQRPETLAWNEFRLGDDPADRIRVSGHVCRINRPDT